MQLVHEDDCADATCANACFNNAGVDAQNKARNLDNCDGAAGCFDAPSSYLFNQCEIQNCGGLRAACGF